jgi:hypothetical protein
MAGNAGRFDLATDTQLERRKWWMLGSTMRSS